MASLETKAAAVASAVRDVYSNTLVGFTLATILYGATVLQTFFYARHYCPNDRWLVRLTILLLFLLDSLTTALVAASMYTHLVVNFGQPSSKLVLVPLTFVAENGITTAVILIAQCFYTNQIWSLSHNRVLTCIIAFLSLAALVLGIYDTNEVFQDPNLAVYDIPRDNIIRGVIKGTSALNDILIAVALIFYLRKKGLSRTFKETRTMVEKLILYIATRSGLATLAQVVYFVLFAGYPNHTYWLPAHLILSKLYVNSVMASLNVRHSIAPSRQPRHRRSDSHSGITFAQHPEPAVIEITISREQEQRVDFAKSSSNEFFRRASSNE